MNFKFAFSQGFGSELPPIIKCGQNTVDCLSFFFLIILKIILTLSLSLAAIFIAYAGILYITKGGEKEEVKKIHQRLVWAVIGLIVAFTSYALTKFLEGTVKGSEVEIYPSFVLAQTQIIEPKPIEEISCGPGLKLPSVFQRSDLIKDLWKTCLLYYGTKLIKVFYVLALMLGTIFLAWAGVLYISQPEKAKEIHQRLIWGIAGVVIAILSFAIIKLIESFFLQGLNV